MSLGFRHFCGVKTSAFFSLVSIQVYRAESDKASKDDMGCYIFRKLPYSQKTKSSLISCFCSRAYGESIFQMSSLLSTPHTKCII